jgi:hypothetical protein
LKILHFFIKDWEEDFEVLINETEEIRKILTVIVLKLEEKVTTTKK